MKRTPIRRKSPRRKLNQRADLLVKQLVHERDGNKCVKCGKSERIQAAHILSKGRYQRLRFEPLNILTLCVGCHLFGAHKDPVDFARWLESKYPGRYDQLQVLAAVARKVDVKELIIALEDQP